MKCLYWLIEPIFDLVELENLIFVISFYFSANVFRAKYRSLKLYESITTTKLGNWFLFQILVHMFSPHSHLNFDFVKTG